MKCQPVSEVASKRVLMPIKWDLRLALKIAGIWDCFPRISWDFEIGQNLRIFGWDCKKLGTGIEDPPPIITPF